MNELRVREIMTRGVITVSPTATIAEAAEIMSKKKVGCLVVTAQGATGMITDADILREVVSKDIKPSQVKVKDVMSKPLVTIDMNTDINDVAQIMTRHSIKRLPVMEGNDLVGIVTATDIAAICPVLAEHGSMREEMRELISTRSSLELGICEICGTYTSDLYEAEGKLVCEDCWEELGEA